MMKRIRLYAGVLCLGALLASCSDNLETGLYPADEVARVLTLANASTGSAVGASLALPSANGAVTLAVTCNSRWSASIEECDGQWCSILNASGTGDGELTVVPHDNPQAAGRECLLRLSAVDRDGKPLAHESVLVRLTQEGRELNVTPLEPAPLPHTGTQSLEFTVTSNQPWRVKCDRFTFSSADGFVEPADFSALTWDEASQSFGAPAGARFSIKVGRNLDVNERIARLEFVSPTEAFLAIPVDVIQKGSPTAFGASGDNLAPQEGAWLTWQVISPRQDWRVTTNADWLELETNGGPASEETLRVAGYARPNQGPQRSAMVYFRTEDGSAETVIEVVQLGREYIDPDMPTWTPTLSLPWVSDGWTQSTAEICCNFACPRESFYGATLEIRREGDEVWASFEATSDITLDSPEGLFGRLRGLAVGLQPLTRYEARFTVDFFVEGYNADNTSKTLLFETPAYWPSWPDNQPPDIPTR